MFNSDTAQEWCKIGLFIEKQKTSQLTLRISGGGGKIYILDSFLKSITVAQSKGVKIVAEIVGEAYSAHAFLAAYTDKIIFTNNSSLVFHHAAIPRSFLFGLISYRDLHLGQAEMEIQNNMFDQCIRAQILNEDDIAAMRRGSTITIYPDGSKENTTPFWNLLIS
ncbi:hypothetical protein M0R04_07210 [Candidatus Dojkabacteria bacterium]|nr:hypothetical protein [Candidatus Dojkabacteria bacterium]